MKMMVLMLTIDGEKLLAIGPSTLVLPPPPPPPASASSTNSEFKWDVILRRFVAWRSK